MAKQEKGYTPDQIKDAEKLCQLMQKVPDAKRQMFSVSVLAYMNGFEAGLALGRDAVQVQAQTTEYRFFSIAGKQSVYPHNGKYS